MDTSLLLKVSLGDDTRRITISTADFGFDSLLSLLGARYAVDAAALTLKYIDDDNDLITIADDSDLKEAFSVASSAGKLVIKATEKQQPKASKPNVEEALTSLAEALGVTVPPEMLAHAAPFLKKMAPVMLQGGPCAMFKAFGGRGGGGCRRRCGPPPSENADGKALHWGITCDITGQHPIVGTRYNKKGENYDLCEEEYNKLSQEAKAQYEAIEKPQAKHWGVTCDITGQHPIVGTRYKKKGEDYDLCEAEYNKLPEEAKVAFEAIETPRHPCQQQRSEPVPEGELLPAAPLSRGARGPGVAQLQSMLIQMGAMNPGGVRYGMGMFGPFTAQAIASLQKDALGVEPTGQFDDLVRTHLLSKLGAEPEPAPQEPAAEQELPEPQELPAVPKLDIPAPVAEPEPAQPSPEELALEAERVAQEAENRKRAELLMAMGFSEAEVEGALTATQGSLERAADWLFVARREAEEAEAEAIAAAKAAFPEEWKGALADIVDMGFLEEPAKDALKACDGNLKAAIKTLVSEERNTPRKAQ